MYKDFSKNKMMMELNPQEHSRAPPTSREAAGLKASCLGENAGSLLPLRVILAQISAL